MAYLVDDDPTQSLLMSPGMAMAAQAAQNLTAQRMGGPMGSPIDAYQQAVFQRAQLEQQRKQMEAQQRMREMQQGPKIGTYNPSDYTMESWAAFTQTQDPGVLEFRPESQKTASGVQEFERLTEIMLDETQPQEVRNAARVELGLRARAGTTTGQERIAQDEDLQDDVVSYVDRVEAVKAAARERGKAQGIIDTEYEEMQAMLPMLRESVAKLRPLAEMATYNLAGRAFDTAARELGFGATEGGTARAQLVSIVDNQTLPLLRQTFGAAFTAAEGERLRNALLDPNAAPAEKLAQLDAFIDLKTREIEAKRGLTSGAQPEAQAAPSPDDELGDIP